MNTFALILAALAVFRFSELTTQEKGPGDILTYLRAMANSYQPLDGLVDCFYCTSIWWSFVTTLCLAGSGVIQWGMFLLWWMGSAGLAGIIYRVWRRK